MTDVFDQASERELAETAAASAANGITYNYRADCRECSDDLEQHRQQYGICVPCKEAEERRSKLFWRH